MESIHITPLKKRIKAEITIPGSKSYTNRALLMACMTTNTVKIVNPLLSDDTKAMISCLKKLGIKISVSKDTIEVASCVNDIKINSINLNADLSGTTLRFLLPLLCIIPGKKILGGREGLNKRPIKVLVNALRQLGAKIEYRDKEGFPPLCITSSTLRSGNITLDGSVSSQYFSALLMIAPLIGGLTIRVKDVQISKPYIDMTIDTIQKFGVQVINHNYKEYVVSPNQWYKIRKYNVEGDFSSAGYFFGVAALTKSIITVKNLNSHSIQADKKLLDALVRMGNSITSQKDSITIKGKGIKPLVIDVSDFPDQAPTLAVLAAFTEGTTRLSGIQSLRIKETDRVQALQNELKKMNIKTKATKTTLTIFGGNPKKAVTGTYGDHRMAMAFAVAGTKLAGMTINNPEVVTKTFPEFWKKLNDIGVKTEKKNKKKIVLIGFMGSGKSSIAPLLSKKLDMTLMEMDQLVLHKSNEESIAKIFDTYGENHFRMLEQEVAESIMKKDNIVVSAGGGVVMNEKTIDALTRNAIVVFLSTEFNTLLNRIKLSGFNDRPLWRDLIKTKALFELRQPLYRKYAHVVIETDGESPDVISDKILQII